MPKTGRFSKLGTGGSQLLLSCKQTSWAHLSCALLCTHTLGHMIIADLYLRRCKTPKLVCKASYYGAPQNIVGKAHEQQDTKP